MRAATSPQPMLPSLPYTPDQLFFITYGQVSPASSHWNTVAHDIILLKCTCSWKLGTIIILLLLSRFQSLPLNCHDVDIASAIRFYGPVKINIQSLLLSIIIRDIVGLVWISSPLLLSVSTWFWSSCTRTCQVWQIRYLV